MKVGACSILVAAAVVSGGCGGGSSSKQGSGSCTPGQSAAMSISSTGVTPQAVCVLPGGTVTITNHDSVAHDIEASTSTAECTGLNLGSIAAGQAATAMFPAAVTCPLHDAAHPSDAAFQGNVYVTTAPATGPGY
jgi:plastocyanin